MLLGREGGQGRGLRAGRRGLAQRAQQATEQVRRRVALPAQDAVQSEQRRTGAVVRQDDVPQYTVGDGVQGGALVHHVGEQEHRRPASGALVDDAGGGHRLRRGDHDDGGARVDVLRDGCHGHGSATAEPVDRRDDRRRQGTDQCDVGGLRLMHENHLGLPHDGVPGTAVTVTAS